MTDILKKIESYKREEIAAAKRLRPLAQIEAAAKQALAPRGFLRAIERAHVSGQYALIAEIKKASPSRGLIRADFDPAWLARAYQAGGATCLSVLTDEPSFQGKPEHLTLARRATTLPVLRKDFTIDEIQLFEARAIGADAILLIAEALSDDELHRLVALCGRLGMCAVVEAYEPTAFGRAVNSGARVVGVNARNLRKPADIDVGRVRQLHTFVHADQILVAESGITSVDDARMLPARVDAVLVGTALMRVDDPGQLIHAISSIKRTVHA